MKNGKRYRKFIISGIIALVVLILVGLVLVVQIGRNKNDGDVIVKENVSVITSESEESVQLFEVTEDTLVFGKKPEYSKGDIVVAGILESAQEGFIRKVLEITQQGNQYLVKTEPAVLTDVFEEAHIIETIELSDDGAQEMAFSQEKGKMILVSATEKKYPFFKEFEYKLMPGVNVNGQVGLRIWLEIQMDIHKGEIEIGFTVHDETEGEVFIGCDAEEKVTLEKELLSRKLANIQFMVGTVPIVITNKLEAELAGEVYLEGQLGTTVEIASQNAAGFLYSSKTGKVQNKSGREYFSDGVQWNTETKASGGEELGVYLHLVSKLYDSTGVDVKTGIAEKVEGEVAANLKEVEDGVKYVGSVDMVVYPKLSGNLVVTVPVVDKKLVDTMLFEVPLDPFWEKHWDSGENWEEEMREQEQEKGMSAWDTTAEWYQTYEDILALNQYDLGESDYAYPWTFLEVVAARGVELEEDQRGGASQGVKLENAELVYFMKDISSDGIPELFIGAQTPEKTILQAVYSFDTESRIARLCGSASFDGGEIYLCKDGSLLQIWPWSPEGDIYRLPYMEFEDRIPFPEGSNKEDIILDSNTLEWERYLDSHSIPTESIFMIE